MFDVKAVKDYVARKTLPPPAPRRIVTFDANSNTPIISGVRWSPDSKQITFLGKRTSAYQQLFVADTRTGSVRALTVDNIYVSSYDISGDIVVYAALLSTSQHDSLGSDVVDVIGKDAFSLLFPPISDIQDMDEYSIAGSPHVLHVQKKGREMPVMFTINGRPLKIYNPVLSLSPEGTSLITVAPVITIPMQWRAYKSPWPELNWFELTPEHDTHSLDEKNPRKASQYVIADLTTGAVTPLVDAPAGRGLYYQAPTTAFWLGDKRHVILTNTFLPITSAVDDAERRQRTETAGIAFVDIVTQAVQPISFFTKMRTETGELESVREILWNSTTHELTITYESLQAKDDSKLHPSEMYTVASGKWMEVKPSEQRGDTDGDVDLVVAEHLDHPSRLIGALRGSPEELTVWDPNPQLDALCKGKVSVYHWKDQNGEPWAGLLALPAQFDPRRRYPLVIQTHGYHEDRFFGDGEYTTGSGGRALTAKGIVVLQMDMIVRTLSTPKEGPDQVAGFKAVIDSLSNAGLIDRQRVGIIGFSRTCYHTLYALTHQPDLFSAASITDGLQESYLHYVLAIDQPGGVVQKDFESTNGGIPFTQDLQNWIQNAPGFNLSRVKAPLLISALEKGELLAQWEPFAGLRRLKKPVDMVWLRKENAPHILVRPHDRYLSQQLAVDWFDFWLIGHEDPDPAKAEQYKRWRELRKLQEENQKKVAAH